MIRGNKTANSVLSALVYCALTTHVYARSAGRAIESNTGKAAAPTTEDGVDFLSKTEGGVSQEAKNAADVLRLQTMDSIKALLADPHNSRNEFELSLRLGEQHIERADYLRDIEIQKYVTEFKVWDASDAKTRAKSAPQANYKNSETSLFNGVQTFRKLVSKFPTHPRTDQALFSLAKALSRLNDDNAVQYYHQLIKNHPNSPLIPDAWLALGEFHFDKFNIKDATDAYQNVMAFKEHRAYAYAVYKLGWCFYNNQGGKEKVPGENLRKSIVAFKLVVKLAARDTSSQFKLRDEAIRDLVMAFAEAEDTEGAWAYFKENGLEQKFYSMLERLGGIYASNGKNGKAIEIYMRLVIESPTRVGNPQIYKKLVEIYDEQRQFANATATIKTMHHLFVKDSSWMAANKDNQKVLKGALDLTERTTYRFGTLFHSRGQKIKDKSLEAEAANIYGAYLESFEKLDAAYDVRYYLADIQMAQKNYLQASSNFIYVARQKPLNGSHTKDAAFNAVESISILNANTKFPAVSPPGQASSELAIPKIKSLYAVTLDFYTNLLPKDPAAMGMRYSAAQIYFDYGHYTEAVKRFDGLATNFSSTKQGQGSARTIVAYYNEKSDWANIVFYGKKFIAKKELMADLNIRKFIDDSLQTAMFNSAVAAEKARDHMKAADLFLEYQKMYPKNSNADRAVNNAAVNFFKGGQVEKSIAAQKFLLKTYAKSALAPDVMASMAETFEAIAQFQNAAETYTQFAGNYPSDKRAPVALYNAGVLFRGIKKLNLAAVSFANVYRKYPAHAAANDALFESARLKEANHDNHGAISDFELFWKNPANQVKDNGIFAFAKSIELRLAGGSNSGGALRDFSKLEAMLLGKSAPAAPAARRIVAKYLFEQQESNAKAFGAMSLNNGDRIEADAAAKQTKLVRLNTAYDRVLAIRNAEFSVATNYRLGEMHEGFATALFNAPAPAKSNQKQIRDFKSQVEKAGFQLKEDAIKFYETAYQQSSEVETFTSWTQKTYQKMVQLAPQKHPALDEMSANPSYMSLKVSMTEATSSLSKD